MADSDNLTDEQHEQLENDVINRQPIGADEILLVGDVRLGIPVLKLYFEQLGRSEEMLRNALKLNASVCCTNFLEWTRSGVDDSFKTLMEVQRLRDLVREAESSVIAE